MALKLLSFVKFEISTQSPLRKRNHHLFNTGNITSINLDCEFHKSMFRRIDVVLVICEKLYQTSFFSYTAILFGKRPFDLIERGKHNLILLLYLLIILSENFDCLTVLSFYY